MKQIKHILVVGGTHGNEMTGIHLLRHWQNSEPLQRPGLNIDTLIANPEAIALGRRYVDFDLNRAFASGSLSAAAPTTQRDVLRAREISAQYGPQGSPKAPDLLIDIHNSTANMGQTLILNNPHPITRSIVAHLAQEFPAVRILQEPPLGTTNPYLAALGKLDLTVEIGPQAHGTLAADLYFSTEKLVQRILDLVVQFNAGALPLGTIPTTYFAQTTAQDYPRDADQQISAMIHPELWGRDYEPLTPGAKAFVDFAGRDILWQGNKIWPCFIGEAAYLEKNIAFLMTLQQQDNW